MPKTYRKEVTKIDSASNEKGSYKIITIRDEKGEKPKNIFPKDLQGIFSSPGTYDIDYEKDGKFWNIVGAKLIASNGNGAGKPSGAGASGKSDVCMTLNTAIKASSEVLAGRFQQGDFTMDEAVTFAPKLVKAFFSGAQSCLQEEEETEEAPF